MKIINIKFSFKLFIIIFSLIVVLLSILCFSKLFFNKTITMNNKNYTTVLKDVHDNTKKYIGKNIVTSGYIFRMNDFEKNQFVTARDMIVSKNDYRIVGFLCESEKIENFENNSWIEIKGTIKLKNYHGPMPIIEVYEIKKITTPNEAFVLPPLTK